MIAYVGWFRTTEVVVKDPTLEEQIIGCMLVNCFECGGTGRWPYHPEQKGKFAIPKCINCKGTGTVLIGV